MSEFVTKALATLNNAAASAFWFVVVVGVLVFLHEAGHFLTAKFFGMKVDVFSLGFGKRLFGRKFKETDYRLSLIPLGGYVKLTGGDEASDPAEQPQAGELQPDWFLARPRWQRFLVLVMGATVNLFLAVGLFAAAFMLGVEVPERVPAVVQQVKEDSPAERAGLQVGDRILQVGGKEVDSWEDAATEVLRAGESEVDMRIARGDDQLSVRVVPHYNEFGIPTLGISVRAPAIIGEIQADMPAAAVGLREDDAIASVDGVPVVDYRDYVDTVSASLGKELVLGVVRGRQDLEIRVTPVEFEMEDGRKIGRIGHGFKRRTERVELALAPALARAVTTCREQASVLFSVLGNLVTFNMPVSTMSGPLQIAQMSARVAQEGTQLLTWMAFISLQLGILNLLPIPVLDGGHIFILATEGVLRRDLSAQIKERLQMVGFYFLVGLMLMVVVLDINKML